MKITWHGHSCFCVESEGYRIVLDPYQRVKGYGPLHLTANEVLCSHEHFDHNYREAVTLEEGVPSPFTVDTVSTFHDDQDGRMRGSNTVYILRAEGQTVVHLGDLGHLLTADQVKELRRCDVLLLPVGGTYTVDAEHAKLVADALEPRIIVPMHYRRGTLGFENIGVLDDFLAMYPAEQVTLLDENGFDPAGHRGVVVPTYHK
ncbi:MAG: MBL fold metallo-hydrolase [Oscillospiraceae bacterium]|nr:MBL fold metallo-hydrolase [Oscillospiraceae bacterium]